jgi:ribosomal protein S18 acetylase RimI-like enzyme
MAGGAFQLLGTAFLMPFPCHRTEPRLRAHRGTPSHFRPHRHPAPAGYAVLVQEAIGIVELSRTDFLAAVEDFLAIYAAAMGATQDELPSRRAIMERHAGNPGFRALAVHNGAPSRIVAFTYGFHGLPGQWWHDVVRSGIAASAGAAAAVTWLEDVLEVAEVHVHPDYQARGIGRQMLLALTAGRVERTALLSTRDAETPARRLYRSLGFADILAGFLFPGGGPAYAVMGARLPLAQPAASTG